ncbi:unnamed protein product [Orchesella dallaii]|uniref:F-box domain-containing protein n=1 Tax=Orchesella dallaii TaxID=48710 RepID=A0ABP1RUR0_9HEXA
MDSTALSGDRNPLLNHVVLQTIFKTMKFNVKDFSNFRLVSSFWHEESLPIWRQNTELLVTAIKRPKNATTAVGIYHDDYLKLLESRKDPYQLRKYPYHHYKVQRWELQLKSKGRGHRYRRQQIFWEKVGPLMTHLVIDECTFFKADDFRNVIFNWTPSLQSLTLYKNAFKCDRPSDAVARLDPTIKEHQKPTNVQKNLTRFQIDCVIGSYFSSNQDIQVLHRSYPYFWAFWSEPPVTWMEIFLHFPNITRMRIDNISQKYGDTPAEFLELLKSIEKIRNEVDPECLSNLIELDIENLQRRSTMLPQNIANCFQRLKFPLKKLQLDAACLPSGGKEALEHMLETHSGTLETLLVARSVYWPKFTRFQFRTQMQALTILDFSTNIVTNLGFLKQTPNLKSCSLNFKEDGFYPTDSNPCNCKNIQYDCYPLVRKTNFEEFNQLVLPDLEKLYLGKEILTGTQIFQLGNIMPNLKEVRMGLGNNGFSTLCQVWKGLKVLKIHAFQVQEKAILGVIQTKTKSKNQSRLPNLTDLKDLESFEMGFLKDKTFKLGLTNDSILFGLFPLTNLKNIQLCLSPLVSDEVLDQIESRFRNCKKLIFKCKPPPVLGNPDGF